jgi:hypothetical protein
MKVFPGLFLVVKGIATFAPLANLPLRELFLSVETL